MTMQMDEPEKTTRPWLKIALFGSLAVNLLFVGFLAGAMARHSGEGPQAGRNPGLGAFGAPYMLALTKEHRREVLRDLRESGRDVVPDRRARRAMFENVISELRSQPFDRAALEATVSKQADTTVQVQRRAQAAWLNVVSGMTDEERAIYADTVEKVLSRRSKK